MNHQHRNSPKDTFTENSEYSGGYEQAVRLERPGMLVTPLPDS